MSTDSAQRLDKHIKYNGVCMWQSDGNAQLAAVKDAHLKNHHKVGVWCSSA